MSYQYPQVTKLINALSEQHITFNIPAGDKKLKEFFYRKIEINISGEVFTIPVMDEYGDVDSDNPVVLLNLVLQECEFYEDAEDFLIWAQDMGLDASSEIIRQIHLDLGSVVPHIRENLLDKKALPAYDIEFNTGVAQALRKAKL